MQGRNKKYLLYDRLGAIERAELCRVLGVDTIALTRELSVFLEIPEYEYLKEEPHVRQFYQGKKKQHKPSRKWLSIEFCEKFLSHVTGLTCFVETQPKEDFSESVKSIPKRRRSSVK